MAMIHSKETFTAISEVAWLLEEIREEMDNRGWSVEKLAYLCGVRSSTVREWFSSGKIRAHELFMLAHVMGIDIFALKNGKPAWNKGKDVNTLMEVIENG